MGRWLLFVGVALAIYGGLRLVQHLATRRLEWIAGRTTTAVDDILLAAVRATRFFFLAAIALAVAAALLVRIPAAHEGRVTMVFVLVALLQLGLWGNALIAAWVRIYTARKADDMGSVTTINAIAIGARIFLWSVIVLLALGNLGVNVTALVAGLGIGGVAVALAVQSVLGDLLASLSIVLDKPFVVGDFIVVDAFSGTVEDVGLKSTRLRSISGEQIILSNSDLLKSRVRNYKRMTERRVVFTLGVEYGTPEACVAEIPELLRGIVAANEKTRFERAHFQRFGVSSLDFEVVYWVTDPDYNLYMDIQQRINLDILRAFREREIGFALPTQTVRVRGGGGDGIVRATMPAPGGNAETTPPA